MPYRDAAAPHSDDAILEPSDARRRYRCGHRGPERFKLRIRGEILHGGFRDELCPDCLLTHLRDHAISCGICDAVIFPDEAVTLWPDTPGKTLRPHVQVVGDRIIGCLRMGCATGMEPAGRWDGEKFVPRKDA